MTTTAPATSPPAKKRDVRPATASRTSEATRQALVEAATTVFADEGFATGSVRTITRMAGANQAAITYHFGGKDGLYHAVLQAGIDAFETESLIDEHSVTQEDRGEALRTVIRQFFVPLTQPGRLGRFIRIFGREGVDPSPVYAAFFATDKPRAFRLVETLVRRFLPSDAGEQDVSVTTFWLLQQPIAFVRDSNRLRQRPYSLAFDAEGIEWLIGLVSGLALGGLAGRSPPADSGRKAP